jgi:Predicted membrane protein (DUF2142)
VDGRRLLTIPRWAFAAAGYALLLAAWVFASPPSAAPDEPAHAVRAAAAGGGQWEGQPAQPYERTAGLTPAQADYLNQQTWEVSIPARLVPAPACFAGTPDIPATCVNDTAAATTGTVRVTTYATTAPPVLYTLAGLAMRLPAGGLSPQLAGRLALALVCALLLAGAARSAGLRGSLWPAAGLALAVTPMVLFLGASLNPAGVSVCAAICFAASVLAVWSGPPRAGQLLVAALSGAVLALSRPSGLLVLTTLSAAVLPLVWPRWLVRPGVFLAVAMVVAAGLAEVAWALAHPLSPPLGRSSLQDALGPLAAIWSDLAQQLVGAFGPGGEVRLPVVLPGLWVILTALVVGAALVVGLWRDRFALLIALAAAALVATAAYAFILTPVGWEPEGRFFLATAAVVPVLAGFVLHRAGVPSRSDVFLLGIAVGAMQMVAFWENARRYAVGRHGPVSFLDVAAWVPPGGWVRWVAVAGAGCALIALSLLPLTAAEREDESQGRVVIDPTMVSLSR